MLTKNNERLASTLVVHDDEVCTGCGQCEPDRLTLIDNLLDSVVIPKVLLEADSVLPYQGRCRIGLIMKQNSGKEVDHAQSYGQGY